MKSIKKFLFYIVIISSFLSHSQTLEKIPSESDSIYATVCYKLAEECIQNGQNDSAIYLFTEVLSIFPKDPAIYYYRGNLKYQNKSYSDAIADFTKCLNLNPENIDDLNGDAYGFRGIVKLEVKDYYGAISDLTVALELGPNMGMYYYYRANAKLDLEDYIGSISDYTEAMKLDSNYRIQSYTNRGIAKALSNDSQGACFDWEQAVRFGGERAKMLLERCR